MALLLSNRHRLLSIAAILDVFEMVYSIYLDEGQRPPFNISLLYSGDPEYNDRATSSFHLMLYLIQLRCGKEIVVRIAKRFSIDMDRQK